MNKFCFQNSSSVPIEPQRHSVLLIDHDVNFSNYLKTMLEKYSFTVTRVQTTSSALCLIKAKRFKCDLVITELDMPGMNGFKFLESIKKFEKQLPIILISGRGDESLAKKAFDEGACFFLHKPNVDQDLQNAFQHVLLYKSSQKYMCKMMMKNNVNITHWDHQQQSSMNNWPTPNSSASTISRMKGKTTERMPSHLEGNKNHNNILKQKMKSSKCKRAKSGKKSFFYQIIHQMDLKIKNQCLEETVGKMQGTNSCWNLLEFGSHQEMDDGKQNEIPKDIGNGSSPLENSNDNNQVEFNHENQVNQDSSQMKGKNKIDDESQFHHGYLSNYGENSQSSILCPNEEASSSQLVKPFEENNLLLSHSFLGETDAFENCIDYQYEAQMESFYNSWESPPNEDII